MTFDSRDPFEQSRDPMTAWERRLRPSTERHWLLWVMLTVLLVFVAWQGAEWLLKPHRPRVGHLTAPESAVRLPTVLPDAAHSGTAHSGTAPNARDRPAPQTESFGVTKCFSATGKVEYSDGPCPVGSRTTTVWVQPDANLADGMSLAERKASVQNNSAVAAQVQPHERRVAQNTGGNVLGECAALDAHIKWIDAMARQPQSAWTQDELTRDRKESRDRQFRLRCQ